MASHGRQRAHTATRVNTTRDAVSKVPDAGTTHLRLLAVCYGRERNHVAVCIHEARVMLLPVQQVKVPG